MVTGTTDESLYDVRTIHINNNNNEFFHRDLIGCKVINFNSEEIGNVKAVHNFGAGDLLELDGKFPYMIIFEEIKKENINLKKSIIKVDLIY